MNEEEINDYWEKSQRRSAQVDECNQLAKEIIKDKRGITPLWHMRIEDMDFSLQKHKLDKEYLIEGYLLIQCVGLQHWFEKLSDSGQGEFLAKNDVFSNDEFDEFAFCTIANHWRKGEPLIPATIIIPNGLNYLFAVDGKHRLKLANYLEVETIPLIVPKIQETQILALLECT